METSAQTDRSVAQYDFLRKKQPGHYRTLEEKEKSKRENV